MKIGFCFLTHNSISFEREIWKVFFRGIPRSSYGIYIHHKLLDNRSDFKTTLNSKVIDNLVKTSRGYPSLIRATENLFSEAFADGCDYVLLISGDMIPLCSFHQICGIADFTVFKSLRFEDCTETCPNCLQENPHHGMTKAWVKRYEDIFVRKPESKIKEYIPTAKEYIKQFMFFGMTKDDFALIQNNFKYKKYEKLFGWHWGIDEHYWINVCSILNIKYINLEQFIICDANTNQTQAESFDLTANLPFDWNNYFFIRKIKSISEGALNQIHSFYKKDNKNLFVLRKKRKHRKFFNISLHRSATTSTHKFCRSVGLKSFHWLGEKWESECKSLSREQIAEKFISSKEDFDVRSDVPTPSIYDILDKEYPDSRFLLITRDTKDWVKSIRKHTQNRGLNPLESLQYSYLCGKNISKLDELSDEDLIDIYNRHIYNVKKYFSHSPWRLSVIDFQSETFLEDLKEFFEIESDKKFPHFKDGEDVAANSIITTATKETGRPQ